MSRRSIMPWIVWFTMSGYSSNKKRQLGAKPFTRVPAHVTFRSFYVDEAMEIRLVLPLDRNAMGGNNVERAT
jgi:hypothetical protein